MSEDFVTRLRLQLREAAEREERRGDWRTRAAAAREWVPRHALSPAVVAIAVVVATVAVGAVLATLRPRPAHTPKPKPVPHIELGDQLGSITTAFGSVWVDESGSGYLLRMNPRTRQVVARIPVSGDVTLAQGSGAVWVATGNATVLRVDPATNRVVARIRGTVEGVDLGYTSGVLAAGGRVWIVGNDQVQNIDPRTNHLGKPVTVARGGFTVNNAALSATELWVTTSDNRLHRLDPSTGAERAEFPVPLADYPLVAGHALLIGLNGGGGSDIARVDPATGRLLWQAPLSDSGPLTEAGGLLWFESPWPGHHTRRLIALDLGTGRIVKSVPTGEFGASGLTAVGSKLWLTTAGGDIVVLPQ